MSDDIDNRRSFRVSEPVILQYEVISDADFSSGLDRWKIRTGKHSGLRSRVVDFDARLRELLYRIRPDAPATCEALELLNEKLNEILEELPEYREGKDSLMNHSARDCVLSAEGMVFGTDDDLAPQTKLVLRFFLTSDKRFFETFCRVVRIMDKGEADCGDYDHCIAVEFSGMNPEERETIIQHLFSKQSETLRMRRLKLEELE